ncbi:hypothetical protein FACS1894181_01420 [Bacteroidia bacterium]|nr:hypothetical protein FACS1894181_01420 [Bacteroidia bacterium]
MNILISAYACEPNKGSEPGVGWNLSMALSAKYKVFVLTRSNNKVPIDDFFRQRNRSNIQFLYYDLPCSLVKLKKIMGTQAYYFLWHLFAYFKVKKIIIKESIDIIHHVTFNQYRTPSFGFFFNLPFVFGPVGGAEFINDVYKSELEESTIKRELLRKKGHGLKLFSFLSKLTSSPKAFLFSAQENKERLEQYIKSKHYIVDTFPAIGIDVNDFSSYSREVNANKAFTLIYAGRAEDWKGIHLFLDSLQILKANDYLFKVKLIGIRFEKERMKVLKWISEFGLDTFVQVIDFMPRNELIEQISSADLFVYPAFRDSGSMAVLEACALACPVVCFDVGGQEVFPADIILKVPVTVNSYNQIKDQFADQLVWAYNNREIICKMGINAQKIVIKNFTWEEKAKKIEIIYEEICSFKTSFA